MTTSRKKIVVFGGAGFLGSHVADKLSDDGHDVAIFDLVDSPYLRPSQKMIIGDLLNVQKVNEAVKGANLIYNCAGYSDLDTASIDPIKTTEQNLIGNINLMNACVANKIEQFVYASSIYVYSDAGGFYRCSKQASEIYIEEYHRQYGLNYSILRYGTLYGPRADERNSIYRYVSSALEKNEIVYKGAGDELREYIHVRDAAKVSARIMEPRFYNKRFVVTGHQSIPAKQMLEMIKEILRTPVEIKFDASNAKDHYKITPYSFVPKIGEKFAPEIFTDMGQGLIECMADYTSRAK